MLLHAPPSQPCLEPLLGGGGLAGRQVETERAFFLGVHDIWRGIVGVRCNNKNPQGADSLPQGCNIMSEKRDAI